MSAGQRPGQPPAGTSPAPGHPSRAQLAGSGAYPGPRASEIMCFDGSEPMPEGVDQEQQEALLTNMSLEEVAALGGQDAPNQVGVLLLFACVSAMSWYVSS